MFEDTSDELREDDYCDKCDLCVRNSLIPSRGQGLEGSGTILHLVAAPSPADRKTKYVLSGNTGKFIRRILEDKKLLALSYITSVVKCGTSQTINAKAIAECFPRLQKEIARVEPSMFITYGKDPYFIVSGGKAFPKGGEGWISPYVIYNVGIEFTSEEKELYKQLTEQISSMLSIFKGKAKMVNYEFRKFTHLRMDMVEDDMALIKACHMGVNYVNNLTDKVEHIHSETVRNMVAEVMGWKANLDLSNDYNKQVEMYWNPYNILTRTKAFSDAIEKRLELYNNNLNKREAIATAIKNIKGKGLVLSKTRSITNFVETLDYCMCWYKSMTSRICYDFNGQPYTYTTGAKKGEPKVFGDIGIRKECLKHLEHGDVSVIATDEVANVVFDVEGLTTIICTSPYCNPFKTISDKKEEQPYMNKPTIITNPRSHTFIPTHTVIQSLNKISNRTSLT
jgi:hypothetical protein